MASGDKNHNEEEEFCPKVQPINNNISKLSYDEKLQLVEDEAKSLYAFCMKKEFSQLEVHACVSKLRGPPKTKTKQALRDSTSSVLCLSLLVAILATVWTTPSMFNLVVVHAKIASIKFVLPYWNWASLYQEDCMISNPFLPTDNVTVDKRFCEYCTNVVKYGKNVIDRLSNTSGSEITTHYIQTAQPVVVTDTTKDWQSKKKLDMDELAKLYQTDQFLSTSMGSCEYNTNVGFNNTFYDFITAYVDKQLPEKWHASWHNCDTKAGKVLRKYYTRPYFLPAMAQATMTNSIIVAKGKHDGKFVVPMETHATGHWITVVSGNLDLKLTPNNECMEKFKCQVADVTLSAGESVFFSLPDWTHEYTPTGDDITLAIASSALWDDM